MPRPIKLGFDYFSLDTDFFQNKTINALRRAHGSVGVLVYINLLCRIYRSGYFIKFDSLDELSADIAEEIASTQIRRVETQVAETINYLVGRGTLSEALFKRGIISGEKIQEQYVLSAYKAKRNIKLGVHALVDVNQVIQNFRVSSEKTRVNSEEMGVNSEFSTHSNSYSNNTTTDSLSMTRACAQGKQDIQDAQFARTQFTRNACSQDIQDEQFAHVQIVRTPCVHGVQVPMLTEIASEFRDSYDMSMTESLSEAQRFYDFNSARGWDCLPHWRVAAARWNQQKINREVEEDKRLYKTRC